MFAATLTDRVATVRVKSANTTTIGLSNLPDQLDRVPDRVPKTTWLPR